MTEDIASELLDRWRARKIDLCDSARDFVMFQTGAHVPDEAK